MAKDKIGLAVVGLGFVGGQAHVPACKKVPLAELIAVIDVIEEKAKQVATKYQTKYYTDYKEALKNPQIDAIIIAVPTPFHYDVASEAIESGKHVLCEMPLTPTIEESERLREQAKETGVVLMPDLNFRFTPNYVQAKKLIDQGALGKPLAVSFSEFIAAKDLEAQWPANSWAWNIAKSGGYPDFTLSVWSIDLIRWLLNTEIDDVKWMTNYNPLKGFEEFTGYNTVGIIKLSTDAIGRLHYGATVPPGEGTSTLEVYGNNTNTLKACWNNTLTLNSKGFKQEWTFKEKGTKAWGHRQIDSYFVECILKGKKPTVTVEDAIKAQIVAAKMVKSDK